jgi:hypothetical protein
MLTLAAEKQDNQQANALMLAWKATEHAEKRTKEVEKELGVSEKRTQQLEGAMRLLIGDDEIELRVRGGGVSKIVRKMQKAQDKVDLLKRELAAASAQAEAASAELSAATVDKRERDESTEVEDLQQQVSTLAAERTQLETKLQEAQKNERTRRRWRSGEPEQHHYLAGATQRAAREKESDCAPEGS